MKYPVGTILKWTPKALRSTNEISDQERMIVIDEKTAVLFKGTEVIEPFFWKSHDSFVKLANEKTPEGLYFTGAKMYSNLPKGTLENHAKKFNFNLI